MNLLLLPVSKNKNQMLELQLMLLETVSTMLMCLQGNLLRGIDIWLGVAYKGLKAESFYSVKYGLSNIPSNIQLLITNI